MSWQIGVHLAQAELRAEADRHAMQRDEAADRLAAYRREEAAIELGASGWREARQNREACEIRLGKLQSKVELLEEAIRKLRQGDSLASHALRFGQ